MKFRSPLSKATGLGSAKHGFSHWWWQRVTAIALIPMGLWFVISVVSLAGGSYAEAYAWLSSPFNAAIVLLFAALTIKAFELTDHIPVASTGAMASRFISSASQR